MSLKDQIDFNKLPQHIAIIMDGNGRWARQKGKYRTFGHHEGVKAVRDTTEGAAELGIKYLTLYAFSTENWKRPLSEVNALMRLLVRTIHKETKTLHENNIRLLAIGDLQSLPSEIKAELDDAIRETADHKRMSLILALSYSSKWELVEAAKKLAEQVKNSNLDPSEINQEMFKNFLNTASIPDPEMLIRTSGEFRVSNFLLWQIAYSELYFTPTLWPDFRREDLHKAIIDFQGRERRFGKTSEQLKLAK